MNLKNFWSKHGSQILVIGGIGGLISAGVLAVKATPKALTILDDELIYPPKQAPSISDISKEFTKLEIVKKTWKCYIPSIAIAALSVIGIISGAKMSFKKTALTAATLEAYKLYLTDYDKSIDEVVTPEQKEAIVDKMVEKTIHHSNEGVTCLTPIYDTGFGDDIILDKVTGIIFRSSPGAVERAFNKIMNDLRTEMDIDYNQFLSELYIPGNYAGYELVWNIEKCMDNAIILEKDDNGVYYIMDFLVKPEANSRN